MWMAENSFSTPNPSWRFVRRVSSVDELPCIEETHKVHLDAKAGNLKRWRPRCNARSDNNSCNFKMYLVASDSAFDLYATGQHDHSKMGGDFSWRHVKLAPTDAKGKKRKNNNKWKRVGNTKREGENFELIELVRSHPAIYDWHFQGRKRSSKASRTEAKRRAWAQICKSSQLSYYSDPARAIQRWAHLKGNYKKRLDEVKRETIRNGALHTSGWKYFEAMNWLGKYLRTTTSIRGILRKPRSMVEGRRRGRPKRTAAAAHGDGEDDKARVLNKLHYSMKKEELADELCSRGNESPSCSRNPHTADHPREWTFLKSVADAEELETARREMSLTILRKTYQGTKITYTCNSHRVTRCDYKVCSVEKDAGIELFSSGVHNHGVSQRQYTSQSEEMKPVIKRVKFNLPPDHHSEEEEQDEEDHDGWFEPKEEEEEEEEEVIPPRTTTAQSSTASTSHGSSPSFNLEPEKLFLNRFIPDVNAPHKWKFFSVCEANQWEATRVRLGLLPATRSEAIEFGMHRSTHHCEHWRQESKCPYKMICLLDTKNWLNGIFECVPNTHIHQKGDGRDRGEDKPLSSSSTSDIVAKPRKRKKKAKKVEQPTPKTPSENKDVRKRRGRPSTKPEKERKGKRDEVKSEQQDPKKEPHSLQKKEELPPSQFMMEPPKMEVEEAQPNSSPAIVIAKPSPVVPEPVSNAAPQPLATTTENPWPNKHEPHSAHQLGAELSLQEPSVSSSSTELVEENVKPLSVPPTVLQEEYQFSAKEAEVKKYTKEINFYTSLIKETYVFAPRVKTEETEGSYVRLTDRGHSIRMCKFYKRKFLEEEDWPKATWEDTFQRIKKTLTDYFKE